MKKKLVALVMGSRSDWETMKYTSELLSLLGITYHAQIISAHRTPDLLSEFAQSAQERGFQTMIAAAGGAAHLPGMLAAHTCLPVIGVPIRSQALNGIDSLLSIVQMPAGVPVATMAIGVPGAKNAALFAAATLSISHKAIQTALHHFRQEQTQAILEHTELASIDSLA